MAERKKKLYRAHKLPISRQFLALEEALAIYGTPELFISDQGC